jgi:hypothetical protein
VVKTESPLSIAGPAATPNATAIAQGSGAVNSH